MLIRARLNPKPETLSQLSKGQVSPAALAASARGGRGFDLDHSWIQDPGSFRCWLFKALVWRVPSGLCLGIL